MHYEIHITVAPIVSKPEVFRSHCQRLKGKALFLRVKGALQESQAMFTTSVDLHDMREAEYICDVYEAAFEALGYHVMRKKIEIKLSAGLPVVYFEAHWKVNAGDHKSLAKFAERLNLGLSWNLEEANTYYLTRRSRDIYRAAEEHFNETHKLIEASWGITKVHYERVLVDTNQRLDEGVHFETRPD